LAARPGLLVEFKALPRPPCHEKEEGKDGREPYGRGMEKGKVGKRVEGGEGL